MVVIREIEYKVGSTERFVSEQTNDPYDIMWPEATSPLDRFNARLPTLTEKRLTGILKEGQPLRASYTLKDPIDPSDPSKDVTRTFDLTMSGGVIWFREGNNIFGSPTLKEFQDSVGNNGRPEFKIGRVIFEGLNYNPDSSEATFAYGKKVMPHRDFAAPEISTTRQVMPELSLSNYLGLQNKLGL